MVVIYGRLSCVYCAKAKMLADQNRIPYQYKSVDQPEIMAQLRELVPDFKTVPQVFWHGNHVGGYEEFASEIEDTRSFGQEAF
jgi:glutaredoxin 1